MSYRTLPHSTPALVALLAMSLAASLVASLVASLAAPSRAQSDGGLPIPCEAVDEVGSAKMSTDGVITLRLRELRPDSIPAHELRYAPGDPRYDDIKRHLGGLVPGEAKPVPPLCGTNSEP